ncbi:hypothetical protein ONZ43_g3305 [Nemania bipapillata]|uniref:Uncharacterized protein n=1 Tax=Nemania bipapillata TaxID=110536 RepID=A0ACC2IXJ2_9PEZI|nr:hypothetical protein ONZ43_g3305 [Nemania bipapillata]
MLPTALPGARIVQFGAKTAWFGAGSVHADTTTIGTILLDAIRRDRKAHGSSGRPLMFIAHCFGGLAVMQALVTAANNEDDRHIYESLAGIVFMGTPFRGAEQGRQAQMISEARERYIDVDPTILRITQPNDEMLSHVVTQFMDKRAKSHNPAPIVCFYEMEPCDVMAVVNGKVEEKVGLTYVRHQRHD